VNILVCIKEIQNPELPSELFRVDEVKKQLIFFPNASLVTSPFDAQAIEAALRIRDSMSDTKITLITLGPSGSQAALKRGLAMGADAGILVSDSHAQSSDPFETVRKLCHAIRDAGDFDLIITGRQAADFDAGIVGCGMAEVLGIPVLAFARSVRVANGRVVVERVLDDGFETVETPTPCLVTVSNELGEPRKASLRLTMQAAKKPIVTVKAIEVDETQGRRTRERLFIPSRNSDCEMFSQSTPGDIAREVTASLAAMRMI